MKKLLLMATIVAAFIVFQPASAKAQLIEAVEIYFESTTPLNQGESEMIIQGQREYIEKLQKEIESLKKENTTKARREDVGGGCGSRRCEPILD